MLIIGAAVLQQAARQLLPVELGKQVLVADVSQQLDHLLQRVLNGLIGQLLTSTLQSVNAVAEDALGCKDEDETVSLKRYPPVHTGGSTTASVAKGRQATSICNLRTPRSG